MLLPLLQSEPLTGCAEEGSKSRWSRAGAFLALVKVAQFLQAEDSKKALVISNDGRKDPARTAHSQEAQSS